MHARTSSEIIRLEDVLKDDEDEVSTMFGSSRYTLAEFLMGRVPIDDRLPFCKPLFTALGEVVDDDERLKKHIKVISKAALTYAPCSSVKNGHFLVSRFRQVPEYWRAFMMANRGGIVVDLGCGLGQDLRHLALYGIPHEQLIGVDKFKGLWDFGYHMFGDKEEFKAHFIEENIVEHTEARSEGLDKWRGKVDVIIASRLLSELSRADQVKALLRMIELSKPGSFIVIHLVGRNVEEESEYDLVSDDSGDEDEEDDESDEAEEDEKPNGAHHEGEHNDDDSSSTISTPSSFGAEYHSRSPFKPTVRTLTEDWALATTFSHTHWSVEIRQVELSAWGLAGEPERWEPNSNSVGIEFAAQRIDSTPMPPKQRQLSVYGVCGTVWDRGPPSPRAVRATALLSQERALEAIRAKEDELASAAREDLEAEEAAQRAILQAVEQVVEQEYEEQAEQEVEQEGNFNEHLYEDSDDERNELRHKRMSCLSSRSVRFNIDKKDKRKSRRSIYDISNKQEKRKSHQSVWAKDEEENKRKSFESVYADSNGDIKRESVLSMDEWEYEDEAGNRISYADTEYHMLLEELALVVPPLGVPNRRYSTMYTEDKRQSRFSTASMDYFSL